MVGRPKNGRNQKSRKSGRKASARSQLSAHSNKERRGEGKNSANSKSKQRIHTSGVRPLTQSIHQRETQNTDSPRERHSNPQKKNQRDSLRTHKPGSRISHKPQSPNPGEQRRLEAVRPAGGVFIVEGRVQIHADGFGFVIPSDPSQEHVYVPAEELKHVMNFDTLRVQVRSGETRRGRQYTTGKVLEIIKHGQKDFIGTYRPMKTGGLVIPDRASDRHHAFRVATPPPESDIRNGTTVVARIVTYPRVPYGEAEILHKMLEPQNASNDTIRVLIEQGWPREFSPTAKAEAEKTAQNWQTRLESDRFEMRHMEFVTIDGKDARDFDDAVFAKRATGGFHLWVAVADVSHFVIPGSTLDQEAYDRATSVYFPDHVVPMLPEVLSNGVCSLNPDQDRATMVAEMFIDSDGKIGKYQIVRAVIRSHRRMTYEEMEGYIEGESWAKDELNHLAPHLDALIDVYRALHRHRLARGSIDLDIPEPKIQLAEDGTIADITIRPRLEAHRLIEECMLAANEVAAKTLDRESKIGVYRVHEVPDTRKIEDLNSFLETVSIKPPWQDPDRVHPREFQKLLKEVRNEFPPEDPQIRVINMLTLRSMKQARYSSERLGHFALANRDYTHFTSPIRRYPDLMVHRLLKTVLNAKAPSPAPHETDPKKSRHHVAPDPVEQACMHSSDQERAAMEMERKLVDIKKCRYLEKYLGEEFEAWVSGVTEKGVFCQIEGHYVDGLVSADTLQRVGRYQFHAKAQCYIGPGASKVQMGTRVRIQVAQVSIETRRIDFELKEVLS